MSNRAGPSDWPALLSLKNQRALICGASQGIGRSIAKVFWSAGAEVFCLARNTEALRSLQAELGAERCHILTADLQNLSSLSDLLVEPLKGGPITILVNNSGGPKGGALVAAGSEEFANAFTSHILAAQNLVQLLVPGMLAQKSGRIINIISTSVKSPIANLGVSNTIRGAMAQWAKTMANELGPQNITVNNVLPGYTNTDRLEALAQASAQRLNKSVDDIKDQWLAATPLRRFAEPEEIAFAALYLASPMGAFVSGINLPVDGGRLPVL